MGDVKMYMSIYFNFYTNVFFILPVIAAWHQGELLYLGLAIAIMIMSTVFHLFELRQHAYFPQARKLDITLAGMCYGYMLYFSYVYLLVFHMLIAIFGLMISLIVYMYSKSKKSKNDEHIWHGIFHITIGFVSAGIVLLK